jgi:uncharacterized membrane protein YozB (DUF420 family)
MGEPDWIRQLPAVNAALNGAATVLLLTGFVLIKSGRRDAHKRIMLTAFAVSIAFLACYLTYHFGLQHYTGSGSKPFPSDHPGRPLYLGILLTHVVLAATVPVLAIITIVRAYRQDWVRHRRIAKITFPIWLYVSVTGVIIYCMLYHWAK